ncbi:MAG: hypothetical protein M3Y53_09365 [Thermoproteota archaeon]|jgi:hypothetical protein|nr:hypothetical protein [Thermoproteota archaeon]
MLEADDAIRVIDTISSNLIGVSKNKVNFARLPDTFWGYFARGHDGKGRFAVIITYSESGEDVDELIKIYERWAVNKKAKK